MYIYVYNHISTYIYIYTRLQATAFHTVAIISKWWSWFLTYDSYDIFGIWFYIALLNNTLPDSPSPISQDGWRIHLRPTLRGRKLSGKGEPSRPRCPDALDGEASTWMNMGGGEEKKTNLQNLEPSSIVLFPGSMEFLECFILYLKGESCKEWWMSIIAEFHEFVVWSLTNCIRFLWFEVWDYQILGWLWGRCISMHFLGLRVIRLSLALIYP